MKNYELRQLIRISKEFKCEFYKVHKLFKDFQDIEIVKSFLWEVAYAKFKH